MNLIDRIASDTVTKLEKAAPRRISEASTLIEGGHHLAAVYLCGYAAEMALGSAYFKILGFQPNQAIPENRRNLAKRKAAGVGYRGVSHPSHPLDGWVRILIEERAASLLPGYPQALAKAITARVDAIAQHWWPHLRYRDFEATASQSAEVIEATRWIWTTYPNL
jgi:hypothetical protein